MKTDQEYDDYHLFAREFWLRPIAWHNAASAYAYEKAHEVRDLKKAIEYYRAWLSSSEALVEGRAVYDAIYGQR